MYLLTAQDWFRCLPIGLRKKALEYVLPSKMEQRYSTLASALSGSFHWISTPDGYDYWNLIHNQSKIVGMFCPVGRFEMFNEENYE